ncbi:hypothetical protein STK_00374 [Sulfurisphaera tokodaii str. 7]|uniref:Uncharacterized protein n=1 Tax=Sulfurisphaera tokodaii (strain DSM 16993 / JCM 10545 / NBRC 100140 / 7) TaxID=273063 RepID=F9VMI2_SULTO|nr:hypothetical protein STK_00374 [Sulfurisphaera tokodaii str. 7]
MIEKEGLEIPSNVKENLMVLSPHFIISRYPDASNGIPRGHIIKILSKIYIKELKRW